MMSADVRNTRPNSNAKPPARSWFGDAWATYLFGAALLFAGVALGACTGRSLGLWDEAFYIEWIDTPNLYGALVQPFGLFFHPIYVLLGRSLIAIRLLGIVLLVGTGAVMGIEIRRYVATVMPSPRVAHLPLVGAFASLLYYVLWILTPSYNLLANAGGALVLAGGFGWAARDRRNGGGDWLVSLYVGLGGAVTFMGKPTSAVLAGVLVALQLLIVGRRDWRKALARAAIAGASAMVLVAVSVRTVMTFEQFVTRVEAGVAALGADYSTVALLHETARSLRHVPLYTMASLAVLAASAAIVFLPPSALRKNCTRLVIMASLALLAMNCLQVVLLARVGIVHTVDPWAMVVGTPVVGILVTTAALGIALNPAVVRDPGLAVPLVLLTATPYLIGFGTANDLLRQAGMSLFPVLVAGVLCARLCFPLWLALAAEVAWVGLAVILLGWSALRPYNQPSSVFTATQPTAFSFTTSKIAVDPATAHYARDLRAIARHTGIAADTPILDLSGVSPGTVALLGARAPFFPWIIPFSKRPSVLAIAAWQSMSAAEQRRTWIIGPIDPHFAADPAIARLATSGRYRRVAVLRYAPGAAHPDVSLWAPVERQPSGRP